MVMRTKSGPQFKKGDTVEYQPNGLGGKWRIAVLTTRYGAAAGEVPSWDLITYSKDYGWFGDGAMEQYIRPVKTDKKITVIDAGCRRPYDTFFNDKYQDGYRFRYVQRGNRSAIVAGCRSWKTFADAREWYSTDNSKYGEDKTQASQAILNKLEKLVNAAKEAAQPKRRAHVTRHRSETTRGVVHQTARRGRARPVSHKRRSTSRTKGTSSSTSRTKRSRG